MSILTIDDISTQLNISPQYARRLLKENKIEGILKNNIWTTTQKNLDLYKQRQDVIIDPADRVRKSQKIPNIVSLSFFSGGMGLDIGMKNVGIHPLLACEINKEARATIVENDSEIGLIRDIWECNKKTVYDYANLPLDTPIDIIFGGPPCQAFSTAGNRKGFDDDRGSVFIKYLDIIAELKPKYVVLENVRGLQTTPSIIEESNGRPIKGAALYYAYKRLRELGYSVSFNLYNAANFGAPQKRERYVILAKYGDQKLPYLIPTNSEHGEYNLPKWNTLASAIQDIQNTQMHYIDIPKTRVDWYKKIPEGGNWKSLSPDDQKIAMGKKYYMSGGKTGFFRRLSFDEPSPTLVTTPIMPATDLIHPTELRPLSIEEYARIQGFPDSWKFKGKIGEIYKQIGNAVPIKLGEAIGQVIINDINNNPIMPPSSFKYSRYKNTSDIELIPLIEKSLNKSSQNDTLF